MIYAVHTDGGAPVNESALCEEHARGEWMAVARDFALNAEDCPLFPEFRPVKEPLWNDTTCIVCGQEE